VHANLVRRRCNGAALRYSPWHVQFDEQNRETGAALAIDGFSPERWKSRDAVFGWQVQACHPLA
jgi:hypothetical protein